MRPVSALSTYEVSTQLRQGTFRIRVGPYTYRLTSNLPQIGAGISRLYADFPMVEDRAFDDFNVGMTISGMASRLRGRANFLFDYQSRFGSIPVAQVYAFMEWGMNWCISLHCNEYLKLHAAAVARNGSTIIMPGVPGAGKSTLCAAMGLSGWRVLSDEHAMIVPGSADIVPLCRPVSLKNESIQVIRGFDANAVIGPVSEDTHKGSVAHMKADLAPDSHDASPITANIMLFPRYSKEEPQRLSPRRRTTSFVLAAYHSFNYSLLGDFGFHAMRCLIDKVECYDLVYHDLDWALHAIGDLHEQVRTR